ncbi:TRAP transporter small permease subunit [Roseococcus pinisoli]|uniref:TRAP transporter small permease protein n=1 Tax=Roseococcus pinisoli TaxID=2835040 RepID=A0ABS5QGS9_9PROT|nr:TRAP transporter small permease [Roseococcus pinisoli]MBS7812588.1 TRAP transporter small permease [Roseococcus pinisoli]
MLSWATRLRRGVAAVATLMALVAGWNYVACAVFITGDIVGRNVFGVSSAATVEVTGYMLACGIAWALAHTLARRAHIRVDVLVTRLPLKWRAPLHLFALSLLACFAAFAAWAGWELYQESALFDAHDNSALRIPMVIPQGIWVVGLAAFLVMTLVLLLEGALALVTGQGAQLDRLLGSRTIDDEAEEALEAVSMARKGGSQA